MKRFLEASLVQRGHGSRQELGTYSRQAVLVRSPTKTCLLSAVQGNNESGMDIDDGTMENRARGPGLYFGLTNCSL